MNYLAIGLIIVLLIVLYYIYYFLTNNTLTSGLQPLNTPLSVTYDKLINPNSPTYSYQTWIYVSGLSSDKRQIFYKGPSSTNAEFEVALTGQVLKVSAGQGNVPPTEIMTVTDNFPIQKWVHLVVNVYNLKTFEAYLNGKLVKTVASSSTNLTPSSKTTNLNIGATGFTGYVTKFTRLPSTLDAKTVWGIYLSGNGLNNFLAALLPYGLNMSVSNGEDVVRVINVF